MLYIFLGIVLFLLIYGPNYWVRVILRRHSKEISNMPGTGGELAKHLIAQYQLEGVSVEETTPMNDHYDPGAKIVRLSPLNYHGKSITAVAVAAHEIGHAIQFYREEKVTRFRQSVLPKAYILKRIGVGIMFALPLVAGILHIPHAIILAAVTGIITMLVSALMYIAILPEEWDASFYKALPILIQGEYIENSNEKQVRQVLKAAALTYFAAALADILSLWRWLLILRGMK